MNESDYDPSEWVSNKEAREILDVSAGTLRNYLKSNKIITMPTSTGRYRYNRTSLYELMGFRSDKVSLQKKKICYARVSSKKQRDDLERQIQFFKSKYPGHEVVSDVGSGINWKRKGLQTILEQSMQGIVSEVVVAHRDRLCRFGFELIEFILRKNNVSLMVLGNENERSESQELGEDIMSIIHVYSCKKMGKRRYKYNTKKSKDKNLSKSETAKITK